MTPEQLLPHARALIAAQGCHGVSSEALARVLARGRVGRAKEGSVVIKEGTDAGSMYFLLEGEVRVRQRDLDGKMRDLTTLSGPTAFGQMALVDARPRSARCVAMSPVVLVEIPGRLYEQLRDSSSPEGAALRRFLLRCLSLQLARGNARLRQLVGRPGAARPSGDVSVHDLLKVTGALDGWETKDVELNAVELIVPDTD